MKQPLRVASTWKKMGGKGTFALLSLTVTFVEGFLITIHSTLAKWITPL
jgi:hypothetical protein